MNNSKRKNIEPENNEVEEMLRQAEDAVMLKLNVNSHMAHVTHPDLDPDLDHRFQTLKYGSSVARKPALSAKTSSDITNGSQESSKLQEDDPDDLLARFSALKASLTKPSPSGSSSSVPVAHELNNSDQFRELNSDEKFKLANKDDSDDGDEVEKVMRWAMDAARLDPSPLSDGDDDVHSHDSGGDDNDDDCSSEDEGCYDKKRTKQRGIKK